MITIFKPAVLNILRIFYKNRNQPVHLREITRNAGIRESAVSRHLNAMEKEKTLLSRQEANLRKFSVNKSRIPEIFPLFDNEKIKSLPLLRRNALKMYIDSLETKPVLLVLFGSTAKGGLRPDSDMDILEIFNAKTSTSAAARYAESQTSIRIQAVQMTFKAFVEELKLKKDAVVQSAVETGFPVFNQKYYYEVLYNE
ncbi:MAG: nucleotidyltransferase domain-containing protein [Candidatus Nanoarchaeia archaeon]|nr:nucleotidyltransferase domain-containing protein [Candidatus Nanoarchaeia archaeon]